MNTTQSPPQTGQPVYEINDKDRERIEKIQKAWQAYETELAKPFVPLPGEPDPNVMGNEVLPAVDTVVSFVFGDEVEISVDQGAPEGAQDFLNTVWGRKEARIPLLQRWLMNGDMSGRAFLRIVPGPDAANLQDRVFELVEVDPCTIFVKTAPQNCQKVMLFCIEYCCDEKNTLGKPVKMYYREEISRIDPDQNTSQGLPDKDTTWSIQHWTQDLVSGNMLPTNDNWIPAGEPIPWPYPFPPIFSNQNLPRPNEFWGYPGVNKALIGINEAINLVNSNINITEKIQRILYSNGVGDGTIDVHPNKITQLPEIESKIAAVNLQTNTANSREFAGDLRGEAEELTGVPMIASGRTAYMPSGNLSGIAIKLLFMSLLKKRSKMCCLYGNTIIEVSQALLVLAGFSEKIEITLGWQNPLPADVLADVQAAQLKQSIGVSKQTTLRELGYDPEEEAKLCAEEAAEALADNPLMQQGMVPGQNPLQGDDQQDQNAQQQNMQQDANKQSGQNPIVQKG
jgi:hypothetical protein